MPVRSRPRGPWRLLALAIALAPGLSPCLAGDASTAVWDLGEVRAGTVVRRDFPLAEQGVTLRGFSVSGADARVRITNAKSTDEPILVVELCVPPVSGPFRGVVSIESTAASSIHIEFRGTSIGGTADPQVLSSDSYRLDVSGRGELTPGGRGESEAGGLQPWAWGTGGVFVGALLAVILRKALAGSGVGADRNNSDGAGPPR